MLRTEATTPPGAAVLEVSLFGPGCGEAIAVHLGEGRWMLVDSCLDEEGSPAALGYLEAIGVAPEQVVLVVATHWHDDHIAGLAETVQRCADAEFVYSGALRSEEFFALVGALSERSQISRSGVTEFAAVVETLDERGGEPPRMAVEGRRLWTAGDGTMPAFVDALSPSDTSMLLSQRAIAELLPSVNTHKKAVAAPKPNHASIVLWVGIGEERILLGADLEETANPGTGWTALLD
ncbi:MAG TPA: MBL fold metallo-hydrolase, partial [Solirubrobacterales bacterium]|nr:MBL fold metallo-hydrolase [Solirubrobacterales bacterium]